MNDTSYYENNNDGFLRVNHQNYDSTGMSSLYDNKKMIFESQMAKNNNPVLSATILDRKPRYLDIVITKNQLIPLNLNQSFWRIDMAVDDISMQREKLALDNFMYACENNIIRKMLLADPNEPWILHSHEKNRYYNPVLMLPYANDNTHVLLHFVLFCLYCFFVFL